ncbi:MAG: YceI family protein [Cyclobacteriaceae bacterium]|nr:YceI family protein [Cyclobacteriaceae bacterium]
MKKIIILIFLSGVLNPYFGLAQKYKVSESKVIFFSQAALEDITAYNTAAAGIFESSKGEIAFAIPINKFEFEKALMKEHFNEKYMHSDKYPRAMFVGIVSGFDLSIKEKQTVVVKGKLTIHGVSKEVSVTGTFEPQGNTIKMSAKFPAKLVDYKIERPQLLWENIAEEVEITVDFNFNKQ